MSDRHSGSSKNRLINEKSPYLLQHAHNPVDWYPWGDEAFSRANAEDKPIFLSIGYSTCHWCHVMSRESFEDHEVAAYLNEHFISIKVDREERPDVDHVYMSVCHMLTGGGGWPLSIVMTPEKKPFWAGTYLPRRSRFGLPGFLEVLGALSEGWSSERESLYEQADKITTALKSGMEEASAVPVIEPPRTHDNILDRAFEHFVSAFDEDYGGFGGAPKFPTPHNLMFLLRYWRRTGNKKAFEMVESTLRHMYAGGIYDHIGFGFFRYSTDARWMVPHFEKMLYDNALLMMVFTDMAQATQKSCYREVVWEIASFLDSEMKSPFGAFYTAIDAESEGEEGKYYVWTPAEVASVLGPDGNEFAIAYGISAKGNFGAKSIPNLAAVLSDSDEGAAMPPRAGAVERSRKKLFAVRSERVRPGTDDKVLTSQNALVVSALAKASRAFDDPDYLDMARDCLDFLLENLVKDGELYARYREKDISHKAYLDDYAFLTWSLLEMHQTTLGSSYLERAEKLAREMVKRFWDDSGKGFFLTSAGAEDLIVRPKEIYDGAVPSGNSVAIMDLLRLSHLLGAQDLDEFAAAALEAMLPELRRNPLAHAHHLSALDYFAGGAQDIKIRGSRRDPAVRAMTGYVSRLYLPNAQVSFEGGTPETDERAELVICQRQTCGVPIHSVDELQVALMSAASKRPLDRHAP